MRTTRKLTILCLAAFMACLSMMPATFSWYAHNTAHDAAWMKYTRSNLPVSGSSGASISTVVVDKNGKEITHSGELSDFDSSSTNIQYYKTTIDNNNSASGDIYGDLNVSDLINDAKIKVGVISPVINEKGFDISKNPVNNNTIRIYFQPTEKWKFWIGEEWDKKPSKCKLRYFQGSEDTDVEMTRISDANVPNYFKDACQEDAYKNKKARIFSCDIPNDVTKMFFYNSRYYKDDDNNKNYNRTRDIIDIQPGNLYRLTGGIDSGDYKVHDVQNYSNFATLISYYDKAELDVGGHINLSLKKSSELENPEEETPNYYGNSISYSLPNSNVATVDNQGVLTINDNVSFSNGIASTTLTTTIKGLFNDTITCETKIYVREKIPEFPVAQNIKVAKGKSVDVYWYVLNKTNNTNDIFNSIFWTY